MFIDSEYFSNYITVGGVSTTACYNETKIWIYRSAITMETWRGTNCVQLAKVESARALRVAIPVVTGSQ